MDLKTTELKGSIETLIRQFINDNNVKALYHLTTRSNLESIIKLE